MFAFFCHCLYNLGMSKNYTDIDKAVPGLGKEYRYGTLEKRDLSGNPFTQFGRWLEEAVKAKAAKPEAMVLSTVSASGAPSSRVLLLKGFNKDGFLFYTNYASPKGRDLAKNPQAAMLFFWPEQERQVRLTGRVQKISQAESEKYFRRRSEEAQIAAWASAQSEVIADRKALEERQEKLLNKFDGKPVPRPASWGGYRLKPATFEFWQGREHRLNDRFRYRKTKGRWVIERLQP